jgi:Na+/proline symporter
MGIGGSIFLIALGAILAFAVNADIGVLDLSIVGWVLMVAGLAGLIITIWFWQSRRRTVVSRSADAAYPQQGQVIDEYREVRREQPPL